MGQPAPPTTAPGHSYPCMVQQPTANNQMPQQSMVQRAVRQLSSTATFGEPQRAVRQLSSTATFGEPQQQPAMSQPPAMSAMQEQQSAMQGPPMIRDAGAATTGYAAAASTMQEQPMMLAGHPQPPRPEFGQPGSGQQFPSDAVSVVGAQQSRNNPSSQPPTVCVPPATITGAGATGQNAGPSRPVEPFAGGTCPQADYPFATVNFSKGYCWYQTKRATRFPILSRAEELGLSNHILSLLVEVGNAERQSARIGEEGNSRGLAL